MSLYPNVPAQAPPAQECASQVEIRIHCKDLMNKDVTSKSDPCAALYLFEGAKWSEIGRTEKINNNLNPQFSTAIGMKYYFETAQKIKICVYDVDNATSTLDDDDFLGSFECTLGQLVSGGPLTKKLVNQKGKPYEKSFITVSAEEVTEKTELVQLSFKAKKLDDKDFFGKSDPFLEFSRQNSDGSWQVVHRTEVVKNNLNPTWKKFELTSHALCKGNKQAPIRINCYDWDSDGSHDMIGCCEMTLTEMMKANSSNEVVKLCIHPKNAAKKKSSGSIILYACKVSILPSFLNYIMAGTNINFTVGVDFTGSNGDPNDVNSLHYIHPERPNDYMQAILSVGQVCEDYDTDKFFPALGFGAKLPPTFEVFHEFAINFNPQNPFCEGIHGVLTAYQNCIRQIQLWGPTNVAPIIRHVAKFAFAAQNEEATKGAAAYFILLLLTDGVITDMNDTVEAIIEASSLPMSLIIVGIGNADFTNMNFLDGDEGVLKSKSGKKAHRDIVQFVPFRSFVRVNIDENYSSSAELARNVLAEVPGQVVSYFRSRNLMPIEKQT
ncbi:copine-3 isoform X1 [Octopus sinensis]|uniref:Copine-3 n=1 Tax=Octopus sinensis TaxID=2607531 RepID=A0A7E6FG63_9MOLL|nr:copine-3 isoform X1 [Octopus sinensis]XP_036366762.1 copine-3 isoform X1 [Octopus sinensis]XP_036366763.1 copine-3 isoform X1 [Octopus sinensis]